MERTSWTVRVRSTGEDRATVYVRNSRFDIGAPVQFDQEYKKVSALEHVLAAIGADLVNGLRIWARRRRVTIDDVEAVVTGLPNNPLTYLGVIGEEGHPGLEAITITVYVSSADPDEDVRRVWEENLRHSPLVHTFRNAVKLDLSLKTVI